MPHKHTRREKDESTFDLPPSQIAKPLPPTTISKKKKAGQKKTDDVPKKSGQKRKRGGADADDAPRAFKRLMAFANGKTPRDGLDNGDGPGKGKGKTKNKDKSGAEKRSKDGTAMKTTTPPSSDPSAAAPTAQDLKIRPGERLSEFSRRVDAALPISGLVHKTVKNGKDPLGLKVRRTKKERKMQNMYAEWRKIDRKIKERREEERELAEERELENEALGVSWKLELEAAAGQGKKKGGKKGKRRRLIGEVGGPEGDPWEEIKKKRGEAKVGLNDVAQAPPELKLPRKNLLVRGAAVAVEDIPKAAGSLRQREELQGIRQEVVASYRRMMSERRPALGT
ncbi:b681b455-6e2d-4dc7-9d4c-925a12fcadaa [Thermothielavioides terrestris]|uniref:B681b455-6e2d-4dc7-9d4c-925a12fcadaa n=1 Tax=Thermothielavioides terrestris TaxID=2587410 RepID=A0A3S4BJJ2_9PEZI|nr:b681b455-6e2d-4dc7-9d4c-925a12fcadaa [Thermothielavioides terrestris]